MFSTNEGRFAEPSSENLEKVKGSSLEVSIFAMNKHHHGNKRNPITLDHTFIDAVHPVTGTDAKYCSYDRFHQGNSKSDTEMLRRMDIVRELQGQVKSQVVEELFSWLNRSMYNLHHADPQYNVFTIWLLLNFNNEPKNATKLAWLRAATESHSL